MHLYELDVVATAEGLRQKEFSSVEATQAYLERIDNLNPKLNAYLTVAAAEALAAAKTADERRRRGEDGNLLGVPLAIKDNITTVGIRTTAASKILENYQSAYDATVIKKLKDAGAVILGKTNLDEFAHGASTENSAFGPTKNPWDTTRVPGGSSGGSAAAVASDLCAGALGSDTGGSIRYPATFCGVVGLKTSYGRVSRSGLLSMTSSTDVIGPITKSIHDAAVLLQTIAGPDSLDQTTYPKSPRDNEYAEAISTRADLKGLRFGVPKEWLSVGGLTAGVAKMIKEAIGTVQKLGGEVVDVSLPYAKYGIPVYYVITPSEISANLARYDGIRYGYHATEATNLFDVYAKSRGKGFGPEAKRRIMIGTYALSHGYYDAYYLQAQKVRTIICQDFDKVFKSVDAIIGPAAPHVAFKLGAKVSDPLKMYLEDIFMSPASLAGLPSLVLPAGFAKPEEGGEEMPVGLQIIGRRFDEAALFAIGHCFEQATEHHIRRPKL
ncbi:aspartyl/glutamyl-tRNA amidotransferase subunit A [Candidatus Uhrbacteria bacterium RIFCSPLOWO2_12_FULL_46_10]|uniref:Glutamyl-tRNA(Gln) amidotransferase subunit A n=1 Tax=Candidatus Uhrbacteria bacterium RIFCSPLOWO2_01_FULL_47_25 TaxID=1802402 RepID=A0A1F7UYI7_9BACT|nr:MAG: Glutamyl-tRNA(Gln) amidotransferase subunit A [Parcubacteria group bacterium GW2011_GWA2_46_9]OGL60765.1 MAG: aspartyl/glutamyl-tRNA amidotransferase subunit A [Candidatus Uhrbacteria bacterium RIFCSPHIGHO2_01_FULL_46_23]OGL70067.1 MAG: aspartyl/glutamyl-tRNA amidotransferase subunit A [Candidatus Uhrbacteria bacterium RIFCSPHIGHO2_02_FULL_47_29]OGL75983.1 MAG: aspartyl/glutamyl-tRNA amidotransferase subunit A [Candidatus Uhrbacteria bacterium RIFCSPHIGHO2_12_FULL_46_13]OGL82828.1 MAG: 